MRHLLLLAALVAPAAACAQPRPAAAQLGQDYALAACLTAQPAGPLRDEGYRLGQIVTGSSGRSPLDFGAVNTAVRQELGRRPMTTVHTDGPVAESDKPAVVAHCLAVSRSAPVRSAIARLR